MSSIVGFLVYFVVLLLFLFFFRDRLVVNVFLKIFYIGLVRTRIGLNFFEVFSVRFKKFLGFASYASIFFGFVVMFLVSYTVLKGFSDLFSKSSTVAVGLVLPFEIKGAFYVPFFYWLVSVIFVMVVHECSHGVFARYHKIRVKGSGFAVLGAVIPVIPGAFVDVDETVMSKKDWFAQLSVLSAGPFANLVFGALFLVLLLLCSQFINLVYVNNGVVITSVVSSSPAESGGLLKGEVINSINGRKVVSVNDFVKSFDGKSVGDLITINSKKFLLGKSPDGGRAFLGVFVDQNLVVKKNFLVYSFFARIVFWFKELFFWLFAINVGVGSFNLLPIGLLDGGRMFSVVLCNFLKHKHARHVSRSLTAFLSIVLLISLIYPFLL